MQALAIQKSCLAEQLLSVRVITDGLQKKRNTSYLAALSTKSLKAH